MWYRLIKRLLTSFYSNLNLIDFSNIDEEKIETLIQKAKNLNDFYNKENFKHTKAEKYVKIIEIIKLNYRSNTNSSGMFVTNSITEKFLLFLYSVDPEFDAVVIFGSGKDIKSIERKMIQKFGIYDLNLINLEKLVLENLLSKQKQEEINIKIKKNI